MKFAHFWSMIKNHLHWFITVLSHSGSQVQYAHLFFYLETFYMFTSLGMWVGILECFVGWTNRSHWLTRSRCGRDHQGAIEQFYLERVSVINLRFLEWHSAQKWHVCFYLRSCELWIMNYAFLIGFSFCLLSKSPKQVSHVFYSCRR